MFSHELEVGVKCSSNRGCFASHALTLGWLWVAAAAVPGRARLSRSAMLQKSRKLISCLLAPHDPRWICGKLSAQQWTIRTKIRLSSPPTGSASPCSTQNSRTGSCDHSSTPTNHQRPSTSAAPSKPSKAPSTNTSTTPASHPPAKTRHNLARPRDQVELLRCPGLRPEPVAPSGQSGRHARLSPCVRSGLCAVEPEAMVSLESADDRPVQRAVRRSADGQL